MNCYETVARLHLYLGRELSAEEVAIVQSHLTACPDCECRFHFDMRVTRLIHERCTIEKAPEHLRKKVLEFARTPKGKQIDLDPDVEMEIRADIRADFEEW
ncbi:MAG TPA: zf-HC2 domain-containing protein [Ktedonobacteraceae bacterium]